MHLLFILLIVGLVLFILLKTSSSPQTFGDDSTESASVDSVSANFSNRNLAFISRGKLFLKKGNAELSELQSPYVQGVMDRMEQARQRHSWKEGTAFETSFISNRTNVPSDQHNLKATTAQFTPDGKMIYFLRDEQVGGLFEYDLDTGSEKRLIHRQHLLLEDMSLAKNGQHLICSQHNSNGTANICLMDSDGGNYQEITGGDTMDSKPAWLPDDPDKIVFQSSGLARNESGYVLALGPASIQMLDLQKRELIPVRQDEKFDFLQPKVSPKGDLFFIRRPFELPSYHSTNFITDFLLFPFRLLRAVFHYLNFFSLMYTQKPLTSASGPEVQADMKELLIKGKRINAENALKKENAINGVRSLVPKTWQLIRRTRQGEEQVLATNVAAYDITHDGTIIFTNGYGVFMLDSSNGTQVVLRNKLIAELIAY